MATGQTDLDTLRLRQQLALSMFNQPRQSSSPLGAGLEGLAKVLSARNVNKTSEQANLFEKEERGKDMAALSRILAERESDPSQLGNISDPRLQELAMSLMAKRAEPKSPIRARPGDTFLNPDTLEPVATGGPAKPDLKPTGVPGIFMDANSRNLVDAFGNEHSLSEFRETPEQKRQRDLEAQVKRKEAEDEIKAEREKIKAFPKQRNLLSQQEQEHELVTQEIDDAIRLADKAAGLGTLLSGLPSTEFKTLNEKLKTIKANIGFSKLQKMRENSPTGGALGQVSEFENELLQATQGSLDQGLDPEVLKQNLKRIRDMHDEGMSTVRQAFRSDFADLIEPQEVEQLASELPDASTLPEGTKATDEETGEVWVIQNGEWKRAVQN